MRWVDYLSRQYAGGGAGGGSTSGIKEAGGKTEGNTGSLKNPQGLTNGQTITGEVQSIQGKEIQIVLDGNKVITATLDSNMSLKEGQTISFEVQTQDNKISLRPLLTNMETNPSILKAIDEAGLPVTRQSIEMVSSMMDEGMSVNRQAVQGMYRQVVDFQDVADPKTIVEMNSLKLSVTPENVEQFQLYKNYEHQMIKSMDTVSGEIINLVEHMLDENPVDAGKVLGQILSVFSQESPLQGEETVSQQAGTASLSTEFPLTEQGILAKEGLQNLFANGLSSEEKCSVIVSLVQNMIQEGANPISFLSQAGVYLTEEEKTMLQQQLGTVGLGEAGEGSGKLSSDINQLLQQMIENTALEEGEGKAFEHNRQIVTGETTPEARVANDSMQELLKSCGFSQEVIAGAQSGQLDGQMFLQEMTTLLNASKITPEDLKALLKTPEFSNLLRNEIISQWVMEPKDLTGEKSVEALYEKIRQQSNHIANAVENILKQDPSLSLKSIQNIRDNVEFINQLNQNFQYVQLPLKMNGKQATGDLYVYANKKNLAKKDGNVSALLHLEMDNLGVMDIYVAMTEGKKVSTKFYLASEELLDFIEEHIDMLNDRLQKRGYQSDTKLELRKEKKTVNILEEMVAENHSKENGNIPTLLAKTSFDVRA